MIILLILGLVILGIGIFVTFLIISVYSKRQKENRVVKSNFGTRDKNENYWKNFALIALATILLTTGFVLIATFFSW